MTALIDWLDHFVRKHGRALLISGLALLLVSAVPIAWLATSREAGSTRIERAYFYDLNTGELFTRHTSMAAPIPAPSNAASEAARDGVRAIVFACGECTPNSMQIAYLRKYTDAYKQMLELPEAQQFEHKRRWKQDGRYEGPLVRSVNGREWRRADSDYAATLERSARRQCESEPYQQCFPQ